MARNEKSDFEKIVEEVGTHDHIVIDDGDGNEYTIRYPRAVVRKMESDGTTIESVQEELAEGTLHGAERFEKDFVLPGLKSDQPKITVDEALELWEAIGDKETLISYLSVLFTQGVRAITGNPITESRMKFRLV